MGVSFFGGHRPKMESFLLVFLKHNKTRYQPQNRDTIVNLKGPHGPLISSPVAGTVRMSILDEGRKAGGYIRPEFDWTPSHCCA